MLLMAGSSGPMTFATLADTFGTGGNTFTIDFVTIGDPGNPADTTGYGAVPYTYQMGKYEVSQDMMAKANNPGTSGSNQPATQISWFEAAKFVNWLNTSTGHSQAYNFDSNGDFNLWSVGEAWQMGGQNLFRNKDAHYFLPNESEWYKAAYFNGTRYFTYQTGSDTAPTPVAGGTAPETAVYLLYQGPADINNAGGLSPYGTMGQAGNAWEWQESAFDGINDSSSEARGVRGGSWDDIPHDLTSPYKFAVAPTGSFDSSGFRVAAVPEPEQYAAVIGVALLGTGVWLRRKKS